MPYADRITGVVTAALSRRSLDARLRLASHAAGAAILFLLVLAVSGQVMASRRLAVLQYETYPALRDVHTLAATFAAYRAEQVIGSPDADRVARADALADRFHRIARASAATGAAMAEARFAEFVDAMRGTTTRDAEGTARRLETQLASEQADAERAVTTSLATIASLHRYMMSVLAIAGALGLAIVALLGLAVQRSIIGWVRESIGALDALAAGDFGVMIRDTDDEVAAPMGAALRRMARQLRDNSEVAHALAAGAYRRAARPVAPQDPTGLALAQLAATMEEIASSAQRIARGDLRACITPQSPDDAFGQAHSAMLRRITTTMRDVDATRQRIATEIADMRGDAAGLTASTSADVDRVRRALDRVAFVTLQTQADATRGAGLADRAVETEAVLERGTTALESSVAGIREVLQRSEEVQRLARNAGIVAVCAMAEAAQDGGSARATDRLEEEARQLATEASKVASEMTRIMIDGTERAHESGVAIDNVALAVRESAEMVREIGTATRRRAAELLAVDEQLVQVEGTLARGSDAARQLTQRLDVLSSHVRQLEAVLRRLNRGQAPVVMATSPGNGASRPTLYRTPPHTLAAFPKLTMMAQ